MLADLPLEELIDNVEVKKLWNKVKRGRTNGLSFEDLESIRMEAVWKAKEKYDPSKSLFTTFLHNIMFYTLVRYTRKERYRFRKFGQAVSYLSTLEGVYSSHNHRAPDKTREMLDSLNSEDKDVLKRRYLENKTLREIAIDYKCSGEMVRKKIKKAINNCRRINRICVSND